MVLLTTFEKFYFIMKRLSILIALLSIFSAFGQNHNHENRQIADAERKSATNVMNAVANVNTQNYDVKYHRMRFTVDPATLFITGEVTTHYRATQNLNTVTFDLNNTLTVSSVLRHGTPVSFIQNTGKELVITLPATQNANVLDSLTINYSGVPTSNEGSFTKYTHAGVAGFYTLSEPFGARDWWPCKQDLNDKVDNIDVYLTMPSQYVAVSNGLQINAITNSNNTKTTHFKHNYPIPAYLIAIAGTNYSIFTQQAGTAPNTFPIVNYIYPETQAATQNNLAVTLPIMNLYEQLFETYPFHNEKYGHAQCALGGGMEHTTVSFMGGFDRNLIAHELGHQWFGDKITCGSWKDIWLNEGFATYLSGLVIENLDGATNFNSWKGSLISDITSQNGGAVYLTDLESANSGRIFSSRLSYNKGAMVAHMLRFKLGDAVFFQGMKNYLADPNLAYGYASTQNLKTHLATASGMNLDEFFNDWVYKQGYPTYSITAQNWTNGQVRFVVNQTTSHISVPFFEMPVPVRVTGAGGQSLDLVLDNTSNGQIILKPVPFTVTGVVFNPKNDIISKNSTMTLGNEDFALIEGIKLYPNPTSNTLNLQLPESVSVEKAVFYNSLGQIVKESKSETSWDVSSLPTGINYIKIYTDSGIKQMKFVKV